MSHNKVYIRQEQGEWEYTHPPNKVCISFIFTKIHHLIILFSIYTHYLNTWSTPHHPWKWALMLIFKGGYWFSITTTLPLLKLSVFAHFRWWLLVFYHHHHTTIETKYMCSFSIVVACFSSPPPYHHQKWACMLVFKGGCFFCITTTPLPLKTSIHTCFRCVFD